MLQSIGITIFENIKIITHHGSGAILDLVAILPTEKTIEVVSQCKVLFSFGARNGGLDLAKKLRKSILSTVFQDKKKLEK